MLYVIKFSIPEKEEPVQSEILRTGSSRIYKRLLETGY